MIKATSIKWDDDTITQMLYNETTKREKQCHKRQVKVFDFLIPSLHQKRTVLLHKRKPVISKAIITKVFFLPGMEAGSLITWLARETGY